MRKTQVLNILSKKFNFKEKSLKKVCLFKEKLLKFNINYNLISKNTVDDVWLRHILDSAQIIPLLNAKKGSIIADLGTGAGFPGILISMYDHNFKFHVKLYEKSAVKREFLLSLKKDLNLKFSVLENVYANQINADIIVCRAFKKLSEIIEISREIVKRPHKIIILKGKNAEKEINDLSLGKNYSYKLHKSMTSLESKIVTMDVV